MAYQKQSWENFPSTATPISADRLAHMETQYDESVRYTDGQLSSKASLDSNGRVLVDQLPVSTQPIPGTLAVRTAGGVLPGLGDPTASTDAATKNYVDSLFETGEAGNLSHRQIRDLAEADGWYALYDPSNRTSLSFSEEGKVTSIADSLGRGPTLNSNSGGTADLIPRRFNELDALSGGVFSSNEISVEAPNTVMALVSSDWSQTGQYLLSGDTTATRQGIYLSGSQGNLGIGDGASVQNTLRLFDGDHVLDATFAGNNSVINDNSQLSHRGLPETAATQMSSLRLGAFSSSGANKWRGDIGLVLIHENPTDRIVNRMRALIHRLSLIPVESPRFTEDALVFSRDETGREYVVKGNPDHIMGDYIMSMTKMVNALVARRFLTTESALDQTTTIDADDSFGGNDSDPVVKAGDVFTYRDLIKLMAIPSNDATPRTMARVLGAQLPGNIPAVKKYLMEMNRYLTVDLGLTTATVATVGGGGMLSARQVASVVDQVYADPTLREIFGTISTTVQAVGGPNPRTIPIQSGLPSQAPFGFSERICGKTGGGGGDDGTNHNSITWRDENGLRHTTVGMMLDRTTNRYQNLYRAVQVVKNGLTSFNYGPTARELTSERTTTTLDVTAEFNATRRSSLQESGVYLTRTGSNVTLTFGGVTLNQWSFSGILPYQFRPRVGTFDTLVTGTTPVRVWITPLGSITVTGNPTGELQGTLSWAAAPSRGFPDWSSWIGYPAQRV